MCEDNKWDEQKNNNKKIGPRDELDTISWYVRTTAAILYTRCSIARLRLPFGVWLVGFELPEVTQVKGERRGAPINSACMYTSKYNLM